MSIKEKELKKYLNDGYMISFYCDTDNIQKYNKIITVELNDEQLQDLFSTDYYDQHMYIEPYETDELFLYKIKEKHVVTSLDIAKIIGELLDSDDKINDLESLNKFIDISNFYDMLDDTVLEYDKFHNRYHFKDDEQLACISYKLVNNAVKNNKIEKLEQIKSFIAEMIYLKDTPIEKREYSDNSLEIIVDYIGTLLNCDSNNYDNHDKNMIEYYKNNLLYLAEKENYEAMRLLGYEYYEGTNGFPYDPQKSCSYLEKCFSISNDPELARTLGYIYYYGRTTNGIPQKEKAFHYFLLGHIIGGYYEATYKLADCYVKGFGTEVSHRAAYTLVNRIYNELCNQFYKSDYSKFADVALRLGSYYKDGIYVEKNIKESILYYLEARCAIKKRLEVMEYVGDRSVAQAIYKTLKELKENQITYDRIIKYNGYSFKGNDITLDNSKITLEYIGDESIKLSAIRNDEYKDYAYIFIFSDIFYSEKSSKVEIVLECEGNAEDFVDGVNEYRIDKLAIHDNKLYLKFENIDVPGYIVLKDMFYIPQTQKEIDNKYMIVGAEISPNKVYNYLCMNKGIEVGDEIEVEVSKSMTKAVVKYIDFVYEDELPLPLSKINIITE